MKRKGLLLLFMSLCLILTLFNNKDINAQEEESNINIDSIIKKQQKEYIKCENLQNILNEDKYFNDIFAGVYFDELGELNVNYVDDLEYIESKINGVKFNKVKYTKKYLIKTQELLFPKMLELGIQAMGICEEKNILVIYTTSEKLNKSKYQEIVDIDAIEFKIQELTIQVNFGDATAIDANKNIKYSIFSKVKNIFNDLKKR